MAKVPKSFWTEEAHEPAHKSIKNALLAAGETPHKIHAKKGIKGKAKLHSKIKSTKGKNKIEKTMHEFKVGSLHSSSKKGPKVTSRKQAIAISLNQARKHK
jgi:dsDNA-specific endonuclease/ATPase MutS2